MIVLLCPLDLSNRWAEDRYETSAKDSVQGNVATERTMTLIQNFKQNLELKEVKSEVSAGQLLWPTDVLNVF